MIGEALDAGSLYAPRRVACFLLRSEGAPTEPEQSRCVASFHETGNVTSPHSLKPQFHYLSRFRGGGRAKDLFGQVPTALPPFPAQHVKRHRSGAVRGAKQPNRRLSHSALAAPGIRTYRWFNMPFQTFVVISADLKHCNHLDTTYVITNGILGDRYRLVSMRSVMRHERSCN